MRDTALRTALCAFLIAAAGLLAYRSSFAGAFVLDDGPAIVDNPNIRTLWPLTRAMSAPAEVTVAGRPIVSLTLALNYALGGVDPWGYHALNLAIHICAGLVLFGVVRRTLSPDLKVRPIGAALAIAAIWVVHPLQTGSVTYVVQRAESLMGLFYLLTLYGAIRAVEVAQRRWWIGGSIACCALGMASKEAMVTAPIAVWLWDRTFLKPQASSPKPQASSRVALYAGLATTWVLLAALMLTSPRTHSVGFAFANWPWWRYLITQAAVVAHYLRLAIVPVPLVLDYGWLPARSVAEIAPQAAVLLTLIALTARALWRRRPEGFAGAWFFLLLAPTSSIVPIVTEVAAEHRMYLPLAAVVALVVIGADRLLRRLTGRATALIGVAAAAIVVLTFAAMTDARNQEYSSGEGIWLDTVMKRPDNPRAHNNYAIDLLARGDNAGAEAHLRTAVSLDPQFADAHSNLGVALCRQSKFNEGIPEIERALALAPGAVHAERDLAEAYAADGKLGRAADHFLNVLAREPDDVFVINRAAWIRATAVDDAVRNGPKALSLARRAVALTARRDVISLDTLAAAEAETGRFDEAVKTAQEALDLARTQTDQSMVPELSGRLALYQQRRRFRQ